VQTAPSADGPNTVTGGAQTHVIRIHAGTCHSQSRSGSKDPWFLSTKSSHPREIDLLATANGSSVNDLDKNISGGSHIPRPPSFGLAEVDSCPTLLC